jgi:hypothetical protein
MGGMMGGGGGVGRGRPGMNRDPGPARVKKRIAWVPPVFPVNQVVLSSLSWQDWLHLPVALFFFFTCLLLLPSYLSASSFLVCLSVLFLVWNRETVDILSYSNDIELEHYVRILRAPTMIATTRYSIVTSIAGGPSQQYCEIYGSVTDGQLRHVREKVG